MYFLRVDVSTHVTIWGGGGVVLLYAADYSIFLNTCSIFSCSDKILKTLAFLQDKVSGKISYCQNKLPHTLILDFMSFQSRLTESRNENNKN